MDIQEAVRSRRTIRAFLSTCVPLELLQDVLRLSARSPSGGNLQPWLIYVLGGNELQIFKCRMNERLTECPRGEDTEYSVYPDNLSEPYVSRRYKVGEQLYSALGISREDKVGRLQQFKKNFQFFDAPVGLFCFIDRQMGSAQWVDLGLFLQTTMLLLKDKGLDSCAQEAWSLFPRTVGDYLNAPTTTMLFCGMAIGYADPSAKINTLITERADIEQFVEFRGFD